MARHILTQKTTFPCNKLKMIHSTHTQTHSFAFTSTGFMRHAKVYIHAIIRCGERLLLFTSARSQAREVMQSMPNNVEQYCWSHFDVFTITFFFFLLSISFGVPLFDVVYFFFTIILVPTHRVNVGQNCVLPGKFCQQWTVDISFFIRPSHPFFSSVSFLIFSFWLRSLLIICECQRQCWFPLLLIVSFVRRLYAISSTNHMRTATVALYVFVAFLSQNMLQHFLVKISRACDAPLKWCSPLWCDSWLFEIEFYCGNVC